MTPFRKTDNRWIILIGTFILACTLGAAATAEAAGTIAGTSIVNTASVDYEDAGANSYSASDTATTTVNSVFTVSVSAPANQSGAAGSSVYYAYTVTNTSNTNNTFALSGASGAGGNTWAVTLYADDGTGGGTANDGIHHVDETTVTASTGVLGPDATYQFFVAVAIPGGTAAGQTDDTDLSVIGSGDAGAGDDTSDSVTTTAGAPSITVTKDVRNTAAGGFADTATADPTDTLEYRISVNNTGPVDALNVVLTDNDHASTTFVAGSIWIGSDCTAFNGGTNVNVDDDNTQEGGETCAVDTCGQASDDGSGNITAYLGDTATESTGGSLGPATTVCVYFRVTVD